MHETRVPIFKSHGFHRLNTDRSEPHPEYPCESVPIRGSKNSNKLTLTWLPAFASMTEKRSNSPLA
jgi:hypothetical protein